MEIFNVKKGAIECFLDKENVLSCRDRYTGEKSSSKYLGEYSLNFFASLANKLLINYYPLLSNVINF